MFVQFMQLQFNMFNDLQRMYVSWFWGLVCANLQYLHWHISRLCCNTDAPGLFSIHGSVQNGLGLVIACGRLVQLIARLQIVSGIQACSLANGVGNKSNWAYQCVLVNLMLWRLRVLLTLSLPLQKLALFVYLTTLGSAWTVPWSKRTERGAHDVARIAREGDGKVISVEVALLWRYNVLALSNLTWCLIWLEVSTWSMHVKAARFVDLPWLSSIQVPMSNTTALPWTRFWARSVSYWIIYSGDL